MIMTMFRMLVWLALCAMVYVACPALGPTWILVGVAVAGLLGLYWLTPKPTVANWVVIDGSNVMHWFDETPSVNTVSLVAYQLIEQGYRPIVWFDANVGYKVGSRFMNERALAGHLPVDARAIRVAPNGSPADPLLIEQAVRRRVEGRFGSTIKGHDPASEAPDHGPPRALFGGVRYAISRGLNTGRGVVGTTQTTLASRCAREGARGTTQEHEERWSTYPTLANWVQ